MQFSICVPELCLIRFTVKDNDKSGTDLGQYSIPFLSMQHGLNAFSFLIEIRTLLFQVIDIFDY